MTPQQEHAAILTAWAQDPSPTSLGPVFAGPWEWASFNYEAMAATAPVERRESGRRARIRRHEATAETITT